MNNKNSRVEKPIKSIKERNIEMIKKPNEKAKYKKVEKNEEIVK